MPTPSKMDPCIGANATDADFEAPTKEEVDDMMEQTLKLRKQRKLAKKQAEDEAAMNDNSTTSNASNATAKALTPAEREAKKAEREKARAAKKEEMEMLRDLQAVQGSTLKDQMASSGQKTAVQENSYGDTYMKTAVLDTSDIDSQMSTDASGEQKMKVGRGSKAADKTDDAVANTTAPASTPAARMLQDA